MGEPGKTLGGEKDIGVALVIPQQYVVFRLEGLDQAIFKNQRLGLGMGYRDFDGTDLGDHILNSTIE